MKAILTIIVKYIFGAIISFSVVVLLLLVFTQVLGFQIEWVEWFGVRAKPAPQPTETVIVSPTTQEILPNPQNSACRVPDIVGLEQTVAGNMISSSGLQVVKSVQVNSSIAEGTVISQSPPANTRLEPCQGDIEIIISLAPVVATSVPVLPSPTMDRHPGEINLLEKDHTLPAPWATNGEFTYWEGFLNVQNEPFIDIIIGDCGDDEGNGRLDILQIFDPQGNFVVNETNSNGDPKFRIRTFENPGYYRIFLQDNDTGSKNGNGGTLIVEMLTDKTVYRNPP